MSVFRLVNLILGLWGFEFACLEFVRFFVGLTVWGLGEREFSGFRHITFLQVGKLIFNSFKKFSCQKANRRHESSVLVNFYNEHYYK